MLAEGHYGAITTSQQREIASIFVRAKVTSREVSKTLLLVSSTAGGEIDKQLNNYLSNVYVDYEYNQEDQDAAMLEELRRVEKAGFKFSMPKDGTQFTAPAVEGMGINEVL